MKKKILVLDLNFEKNTLFFDEFVKPVIDIIKVETKNYEVRHYMNLILDEINNYNKIILCGVSLKDSKYLNNLEKFNFLKNFKGQVFGICAGAQVIVKLFGGYLIENSEIGMEKFKVLKQDKIFEQVDLSKGYCLHNNSFIVGEKFEELIKSHKSLEMVKLKNKNFYACLFHPEVRNKELIKNFINL